MVSKLLDIAIILIGVGVLTRFFIHSPEEQRRELARLSQEIAGLEHTIRQLSFDAELGGEGCDGLDNNDNCPGDTNGDGVVCGLGDSGVDELYGMQKIGEDCNTKYPGVCRPGYWVCFRGTLKCQQFNYPEVEISGNGVDEDCDGHD